MAHVLDADFETKKNVKAGGITLAILVALFLLFFLVGWTTPPGILQPQPEEGMEVNLGNSDAGLGTDQAFQPGKPSPQDKQAYTPPKQVVTQKEDVKDPLSNDKDEDAPEIKKPPVVKPEATKIAEKEEPKKVMPKKVETVSPPAPPAKPKAVFKGVNGTGTGGNDADSYKKGGNEGVAGGKGDQGSPGGNPDSKNYGPGGGHGNSGLSISKGLEGRFFTKVYNYQGDFDENAKVAVDVRIDKSGNVLSATYQPRGSTTSSSSYKDKAIEIVKKSKLNVSANAEEEQTGTVIINFKINN